MKIVQLSLVSVAAALITAVPALADTASYSLTTIDPTVQSGSTVTFDGTITAPSTNAGVIYLLGDSYTVDSPLSVDDTDFFNDTPFYLNPGGTYSGPLFTVALPGSIAEGLYNGAFDVLLSDALGNTFTDNATFQVTATPEPGSWLLLSTGLAGAAALRRRFIAADA